MNKKAATPISILLLVIMALVLVGYSLFTFFTYKAENKDFFYQGYEDVYAKEAEINFYLNQGGKFENIRRDINIEDGLIAVSDDGSIKIAKSYFKDEEKKEEIVFVIYKFKPKQNQE